MNERTSRDSNEIYLTTMQAAKILQVSPKTLESWRRTQLQGPPYCKEGHLVRYRKSDLDAYMRKIRVIPTEIKAFLDTIKSPKTIHLTTTNSDETND